MYAKVPMYELLSFYLCKIIAGCLFQSSVPNPVSRCFALAKISYSSKNWGLNATIRVFWDTSFDPGNSRMCTVGVTVRKCLVHKCIKNLNVSFLFIFGLSHMGWVRI